MTDRTDGREMPGFETVLMIGAAGLIVIVEFLYIRESASPDRFNTVFKIYMQVWVLASVAAGVVLTRLLAEDHPSLGLSGTHWRPAFVVFTTVLLGSLSLYGVLALSGHFGLLEPATSGVVTLLPAWAVMLGFLLVLGTVGTVALDALDGPVPFGNPPEWLQAGVQLVVGLLVVSAGLYGGLAVADSYADGSRVDDPTLDALAFVETDHPGEAPAIYWLDGQVTGQPNMVSDPGAQYRWTNAPASLTGVPTLVGKPPEAIYRTREAYQQRVDDVETIFTGTADQQRRLLTLYDVELIYVGPNERAAYEPISVDSLDAVTVAKRWPRVTVYRVDRTALAQSE